MGLITRNPYAGMWLLPFLLALSHPLLTTIFLGAAIGTIHGAARAGGTHSYWRSAAGKDYEVATSVFTYPIRRSFSKTRAITQTLSRQPSSPDDSSGHTGRRNLSGVGRFSKSSPHLGMDPRYGNAVSYTIWMGA